MAMMFVKAEGFLCASSAAAAAVYSMAVTSFSGTDTPTKMNPIPPVSSPSATVLVPKSGCDAGKFKPRFDGLSFIETLITAHR